MTRTLEQELADVIAHEGYEVRLIKSSLTHVYLSYHGQQFDYQLFGGWWKYRRIARWVRRSIEGHQRILQMGVKVKP